MNLISTPLSQTRELGTQFWNDSCALHELREAVEQGATGATSNPVIVSAAIKGDPKTWHPVLDRLISDFPHRSPHRFEEELAWELISEVGRQAASILTNRGQLSIQINPKDYRNAERMYLHGKILAGLAPNIAIKGPSTDAGLQALEKLTSEGISVNATVSFTVSQALAAAEAIERGLKTAQSAGIDSSKIPVYVTLMVGRLDDHLQRVMAEESIAIDPGYLRWAGVAVAKKTHKIFINRGYQSTLLIAAYRHQLHWSELIGPKMIMTMPYPWWKQFNASGIQPERSLERPVEPKILTALYETFSDFRRAYDEEGIRPQDFIHFGATIHTLNQFLSGYQELLSVVRERILLLG